jgi:lipoprotein-anchoring transpeptidase ErfK/SrfK
MTDQARGRPDRRPCPTLYVEALMAFIPFRRSSESHTGKGGAHRAPRRWSHVPLVVLVSLAVLPGIAAIGSFAYARAAQDRIMPGAKIAGIDVGNMTRTEAEGALAPYVRADLSRMISVEAAGHTWEVTPAVLGVRADVSAGVSKALAASEAVGWPANAYHRLTGKPVNESISVPYAYPEDPIASFVKLVAAQVHRAPADAALALDVDKLAMRHSRNGRALRTNASVRLVLAGLRSGSTSVTLPTRVVKPHVSDQSVGKTLTVNLTTNTLQLYQGFKVIRTYPVATAMQGFSTPVGTWKVAWKEFHPTWSNPGTPWAKGMPQFIGPGPSNPLGLRALALSAPGVLIHGTPEDYSIGSWASHGCIRMHETDALKLYPLVPVNTPVIIYGSPPWGYHTTAGQVGF